MSLTVDEVPISPTFLPGQGQLEYTPGVGHKVLAARLLYRRPKQATQIRAACMVMEVDLDQEHEAVSRSVIKQVDALIADLPTDASSLQEPCSCCPSDAPSCPGNGTCEVGRKLLEVMGPWLIFGTKECGHVITHVAKRLFEYALHGLLFGIAAARLIKSIHEEQVTKLREAKELKSKPHSIRRVILNLVQGQFYSRPNVTEERAHHQSSLNNVMFIGQLLMHDLLVDSAIHESLTELLRPRNRPDALGRRLEMACHLLAVAGRRLDQGVSMEPYYAYMDRLVQTPEVGAPLKEMFAGLLARRTAWLLADAKEPKTP